MTSSAARITTLKLNALQKIINGKGHMNNPNCRICDVLLIVGESIVTKKTGSYVKWFHEDCARGKNII